MYLALNPPLTAPFPPLTDMSQDIWQLKQPLLIASNMAYYIVSTNYLQFLVST